MLERIIPEVLKALGYEYNKKYSAKNLKRLRFNFRLIKDDKVIYLEAYGLQDRNHVLMD